MIPQSISEKMMYNTVRITTSSGSGTGSCFNFRADNQDIPVLITNKHVINDNSEEQTSFLLHIANDDGAPEGNIEINCKTHWYFHPFKDLCFCYLGPLSEQILKRYGKKVYVVLNDESIIPDKAKLEELSALEEIVMIGYPIGLWDKRNNLPLFRKGCTACHPAIDFNEDGIGIADIACFPGSSGSPVFLLNENSYKDKKGNNYFGKSRLFLLGFLYAGPQHQATGELIISNIPTQQKITANTPVMVNLGLYIKSSEIMVFKKQIQEDLSKRE